MNSLKEWFVKNGGYINDKLDINYKNEKYSIVTNDTIDENEKLVTIPKNLRFNVDRFDQINNINLWIEYSKTNTKIEKFLNNDANKIIITLIYEKSIGTKSNFHLYMSSLPLLKNLQHIPLFNATTENLETWKYLSINFYNIIQHQIKYIDEFYDNIYLLNSKYNIINIDPSSYHNSNKKPELLEENNKKNSLLYNLIQWGYVIYNTKHWKNHGLIPFVDMFEHNYDSGVALKITQSQVINEQNIELINQTDFFMKNDVISLNYGIYDGITLLANYGIIPNNELKYMNIGIQVQPIQNKYYDFILNERNKILQSTKYYFTNLYPEVKLFYYLRITSLNNYEIENIISKNNVYYKSKITIENEFKTLRLILKIIKNFKTNYNSEKKKICIDLISAKDPITAKLVKILLNNFDIIQGCTYWIHKEWVKSLDLPYSINDEIIEYNLIENNRI